MADIQNLDQRFSIVNPDGTPTDYFMRLISDRGTDQISLRTGVTNLEEGQEVLETNQDTLQSQVDNLDLDDLTDVDTTTTPPDDGQALVYDDASSLWVPGDVASGGGVGSETSGVHVYDASLSVAHNTFWVVPSFDTVVKNDDGYYNGASPTVVTVPDDGWYICTGLGYVDRDWETLKEAS